MAKNKEQKWARLRQVAAEEPKEADAALAEVAEALGTMADALSNLRDNLDLIEAPKTASVKLRIAAAKKYASAFRHIAEEAPEVVADALSEVYHSLDDVAGAIETLAGNLGIDLQVHDPDSEFEGGEHEGEGDEEEVKVAGELMEKFTPEDASLTMSGPLGALRKMLYKLDGSYNKHQILGLVEKTFEEKEAEKANPAAANHSQVMASGKAAGELMEKFTPEDASLTMDGPLGALRKLLYKLDGSYNKHQILGLVEKTFEEKEAEKANPAVANHSQVMASKKKADAGAFTTDRDNNAAPEPVEKVEIPEAQGKAAARRELVRLRIAKRNGIEL